MMDDPELSEVTSIPEELPGAAPEGPAPEVSFVIPAAVEETIATDDPIIERELPTASGPTTGVDAAPVLEALQNLGGSILGKLDELRTQFDREIRAESTREKVVDRLHAELQEYKQGLLIGILRPVFMDLIQLHDDIGKMGAGDDDRLASVRQGIEDILYRQGVEPFSLEGDAFDPRRQRALSTMPNDDPALAKTIAARLRKGFQAGDKVIRPEIVAVHATPPRRDP
ncbi:nucleotide exchange factor GrpE [Tundrisphaera sp. TA3]|uniref:nucleotide exchange factor GrpE n=1 Tax=Tundrisphaera sp. TA3 TaxID=3435775 RepID=UPI003EBDCEF7